MVGDCERSQANLKLNLVVLTGLRGLTKHNLDDSGRKAISIQMKRNICPTLIKTEKTPLVKAVKNHARGCLREPPEPHAKDKKAKYSLELLQED